ncbi:MAG: cupin domain-containing protein [Alphaproteobacteria bacterium]
MDANGAKGERWPPGTICLQPGAGRSYALGAMSAVFKADGEETEERYSVSEWWLDPHTEGSGAHVHEVGDELFYVIEGCTAFRIGDAWVDAPAGSFIRIPAGVTHDFANRTDHRTGVLNVFTAGFERHMPAIVAWYRDRA